MLCCALLCYRRSFVRFHSTMMLSFCAAGGLIDLKNLLFLEDCAFDLTVTAKCSSSFRSSSITNQ